MRELDQTPRKVRALNLGMSQWRMYSVKVKFGRTMVGIRGHVCSVDYFHGMQCKRLWSGIPYRCIASKYYGQRLNVVGATWPPLSAWPLSGHVLRWLIRLGRRSIIYSSVPSRHKSSRASWKYKAIGTRCLQCALLHISWPAGCWLCLASCVCYKTPASQAELENEAWGHAGGVWPRDAWPMLKCADWLQAATHILTEKWTCRL